MSDPTFPLFPIFAFVGFVIALIPLPWHLQAWNSGTCIYMIWVSLSCLIQFVDSLVWKNTAAIIAPVWCDISTKFLIGAGVGIPAASLCINIRLWRIATTKMVTVTREDKRRAVLLDLAIGVGIPVLVMVLHYIVQGHRFNILEEVGCVPTIFNTPPAYPLVYMWPVLLGCISFVFAALTLRAFWKRRIQFQQVLSRTANMTVNRYFRLLLLAGLEMACTVPLTSYSIFINNDGVTMSPWISWSDTHYNFSFIEQIPAVEWRSNHAFLVSVELGRWIYPCCAILFFALFGFAEEARKHYRMAFWWIASRFGIKPRQQKFSGSSLKIGSQELKGVVCGSPPAYSPPASGFAPKRAKSFTSTFTMDLDLEKAIPTPSTAYASLNTLPESSGLSECFDIHHDAETVVSSPWSYSFHPSEAMPEDVITVPPPIHENAQREPITPLSSAPPFTAPTVYPGRPLRTVLSQSTIQVSIHKDTIETVEAV